MKQTYTAILEYNDGGGYYFETVEAANPESAWHLAVTQCVALNKSEEIYPTLKEALGFVTPIAVLRGNAKLEMVWEDFE